MATPNPIAVAALLEKVAAGSPLNAAGWERVPIALREASVFSSKIESIRLLQRMYDRLQNAIELLRREGMGRDGGEGAYQTRQRFIAEMQAIAREEGLDPRNFGEPGKMDGLEDPTSVRRLGLIFDIQTENIQEFAKFKMDQDPDVLNAYPAQELVRVSPRKHKREDWKERFEAAAAKVGWEGVSKTALKSGRMVALKTSPVWRKLSRFGKPWPPFDYGSGMGLRDISRRETIALGILKKGEEVKPIDADFADKIESSVKDLSPQMQSALRRSFGDQVEIVDGVARWKAAA